MKHYGLLDGEVLHALQVRPGEQIFDGIAGMRRAWNLCLSRAQRISLGIDREKESRRTSSLVSLRDRTVSRNISRAAWLIRTIKCSALECVLLQYLQLSLRVSAMDAEDISTMQDFSRKGKGRQVINTTDEETCIETLSSK